MKTSHLVILLCSLFLRCERNPCKGLKNGVYSYPDLPENHTMTSDEVDKFFYIPLDLAECISTEDLIESILTYPYIGLIFAHHTLAAARTNQMRIEDFLFIIIVCK